MYTYDFRQIGLSAFSTSHVFNLTAVPEPTYTTTSGAVASASYVTLDAGGDTISSRIASVPDLPASDGLTLRCPTSVIASRYEF